MRVASLADVKAKLSAYLQEAENTGPVVITRNGKAVAILLAPADDDDLERLLLSRSARFQARLAKSRESIREGHGLTQRTFWEGVNERYQHGVRSSTRSDGLPNTPLQPPGASPRPRKPGRQSRRARS